MKTVIVNEHTYLMSENLAEQTLEIARNATLHTLSIYALEKGDHMEMKKEQHANEKALDKAIAKYVKAGFIVHAQRLPGASPG